MPRTSARRRASSLAESAQLRSPPDRSAPAVGDGGGAPVPTCAPSWRVWARHAGCEATTRAHMTRRAHMWGPGGASGRRTRPPASCAPTAGPGPPPRAPERGEPPRTTGTRRRRIRSHPRALGRRRALEQRCRSGSAGGRDAGPRGGPDSRQITVAHRMRREADLCCAIRVRKARVEGPSTTAEWQRVRKGLRRRAVSARRRTLTACR